MKARELLLRGRTVGLEADEPKVEETEEKETAEVEKEEPAEVEDKTEDGEEKKDEGDAEPAETDEEEESTDVDETDSGDADVDSDPVPADSDTDADPVSESAPADAAASDENETEETTVPVEGEVSSSIGDEEKSLLKLNGFDVNEEEAEEAIDEVSTAVEALESIQLYIQGSLESGGLTKDAFVLATNYANTVATSVGLESINVGLESADTRYQLSVAALESIGEKLKEAGKAIAEFLRKLYQAIVARITRFKNDVGSVLTSVAEKLKKLTPEFFDKTLEIRVGYFHVNGKLTTSLVGDINKSMHNLQNYISLRLFDEYDTFQDRAGSLADNKADPSELFTALKALNEKTFSEVDKVLHFSQSTDQLPKDHLAGKVATGVIFRGDANNPSGMISLNHVPASPEKEKTSLSKLGVRKTSLDDLMKVADLMSLMLERFESLTIRMQSRTETALELAEQYSKGENMQDYAKITIETQRVVGKFVRLGSDLVLSIIDSVYELNHAVNAASK